VDLKIGMDDTYRGDITLHMSFSDLSNEKIVTVEIRDDKDLPMARKEKTVSFE